MSLTIREKEWEVPSSRTGLPESGGIWEDELDRQMSSNKGGDEHNQRIEESFEVSSNETGTCKQGDNWKLHAV